MPRGLALIAVWLALAGVTLSSATAWAQLPISPLSPTLQMEQPQPRRAPFTLTPSVTVSEEYNDNVLLNNLNRQSDWISGITPGIAALVESTTYRLLASYDFTAEIYARDSDRSRGFARSNFLLSGTYRVDPRLTLTLNDTFRYDTNTNAVTLEGVSTGRNASWSNTVSPGVAWQVDPRTALRFTAAYTATRFEEDALNDSDVWRFETAADYALTPRLTGTVGYQLAFFDIENQENVYTHTPRLGVTYRITETLTAALSGGPTFVVTEDDTRVTPAATASIIQRFQWGAVGLLYDRAVGTSGGIGGATDNQAIGALVRVDSWIKNLILEFSPRSTTVDAENNAFDVRTVTLATRAIYQFSPGIGAFLSYTFYSQRATNTNGLAPDADQNRVLLGVTVGYPFRFD